MITIELHPHIMGIQICIPDWGYTSCGISLSQLDNVNWDELIYIARFNWGYANDLLQGLMSLKEIEEEVTKEPYLNNHHYFWFNKVVKNNIIVLPA